MFLARAAVIVKVNLAKCQPAKRPQRIWVLEQTTWHSQTTRSLKQCSQIKGYSPQQLTVWPPTLPHQHQSLTWNERHKKDESLMKPSKEGVCFLLCLSASALRCNVNKSSIQRSLSTKQVQLLSNWPFICDLGVLSKNGFFSFPFFVRPLISFCHCLVLLFPNARQLFLECLFLLCNENSRLIHHQFISILLMRSNWWHWWYLSVPFQCLDLCDVCSIRVG